MTTSPSQSSKTHIESLRACSFYREKRCWTCCFLDLELLTTEHRKGISIIWRLPVYGILLQQHNWTNHQLLKILFLITKKSVGKTNSILPTWSKIHKPATLSFHKNVCIRIRIFIYFLFSVLKNNQEISSEDAHSQATWLTHSQCQFTGRVLRKQKLHGVNCQVHSHAGTQYWGTSHRENT